MDRSRKSLRGVVCCNNCIHYQPIKKNGIKTSEGNCTETGTIKKRTDRCNKSFLDKRQIRFV